MSQGHMDELRKSPRVRSLKGARIVYDNGTKTRDCTIRNMSKDGAKLVMESAMQLPDAFILLFDDGNQRFCRVRWRKINEIGVEFMNGAG